MELERSNPKKLVKLLFIFVLFTPSFFIFTTLGIKESYLYFALVFVFICIFVFVFARFSL
jgi:hypothetical protein